MNDPSPESQAETLEAVRACCVALDERKAEDLRVLDLGPDSSVADYFVIATGTSRPHLKALAGTLRDCAKEVGLCVLGVDRDHESGWVVFDAGEVMFHLFTGETRAYYSLETLWKDATEVDLSTLLPSPQNE